MAGEIRGLQLFTAGRRHDDVDLFEERRDLLDGERAGAVGLDVFDGGIEARNAELIGPV